MYVTRGRGRGCSPPRPPLFAGDQQSETLCFTSATPKWTAEYPPPLATRSIFFRPRLKVANEGGEGRVARGLSVDWPRVCHHHEAWATPRASIVGGYLPRVCYFFFFSTHPSSPASRAGRNGNNNQPLKASLLSPRLSFSRPLPRETPINKLSSPRAPAIIRLILTCHADVVEVEMVEEGEGASHLLLRRPIVCAR